MDNQEILMNTENTTETIPTPEVEAKPENDQSDELF